MSSNNTQKDSLSQHFGGIYPIYKERGETLSMLLQRFRKVHNLDEKVLLTYAGRLDPMADGVVIVLAGDARFQKDKMLGLDKVYEMKVLCGVATDSLDVLGIIEKIDLIKNIPDSEIKDVVGQIKDIKVLPYPMYSSRPVGGKPLFMHARAGTDVAVPDKKIKIFEVEILNIEKENLGEIIFKIENDIDKVVGDFRQEEIKKSWQKIRQEMKEKHGNKVVTMINIRAKVSSGTYMRSLAEWIGDKLSCPALAYSITRLKVGDYS